MSFTKSLREQVISQGFKLLSHPRVADLLANDNVIGAISKGMALKSRVQENVDCYVRSIAEKAGLATQDDFADLKHHFDDIKRRFETLKVKQDKQSAMHATPSQHSHVTPPAATDTGSGSTHDTNRGQNHSVSDTDPLN